MGQQQCHWLVPKTPLKIKPTVVNFPAQTLRQHCSQLPWTQAKHSASSHSSLFSPLDVQKAAHSPLPCWLRHTDHSKEFLHGSQFAVPVTRPSTKPHALFVSCVCHSGLFPIMIVGCLFLLQKNWLEIIFPSDELIPCTWLAMAKLPHAITFDCHQALPTLGPMHPCMAIFFFHETRSHGYFNFFDSERQHDYASQFLKRRPGQRIQAQHSSEQKHVLSRGRKQTGFQG